MYIKYFFKIIERENLVTCNNKVTFTVVKYQLDSVTHCSKKIETLLAMNFAVPENVLII